MYFRMSFQASNGRLDLPIGYHRILQGFIYKELLKDDPAYSEFLHNFGYLGGDKPFKLFHFSWLKGNYDTEYDIESNSKRIIFNDDVHFELRSSMPEFNKLVSHRLSEQHIFVLDGNQIVLNGLEIGDKEFFDNHAHVVMRSPLVLKNHSSDYMSPQDDDFNIVLNNNYRRKHLAAFGREPVGKIWIDPNSWRKQKKVPTKYKLEDEDNKKKDPIIEGYLGEFELEGDPHALSFLYDVGLGSGNSDGFGMFDEGVLKKVYVY